MSTVKFKVKPNPARIGKKKGAYVAAIQHTRNLGVDDLVELYARDMAVADAAAKGAVTEVCTLIKEQLLAGNSVNLGFLALELSMKGSLESANAAADTLTNPVSVMMRTGSELRQGLKALKLENAIDLGEYNPSLDIVSDSASKRENIVRRNAEIYVVCGYLTIDQTKEDEGVWLEKEKGDRLCRCEILKNNGAICNCRFSEELARGKYYLSFYFRSSFDRKYYLCLRKTVEVAG